MSFGANDTSRDFTLSATDDSTDDDGESIRLGFGALPAGISAGSPSEAVVSITDKLGDQDAGDSHASRSEGGTQDCPH